jgi:hypothetical protein
LAPRAERAKREKRPNGRRRITGERVAGAREMDRAEIDGDEGTMR